MKPNKSFRLSFAVNLFRWIVLSLIAVGCNHDEQAPKISSAAQTYLENVIGIMEKNSINRKTIDWASFRKQVFERAGAAQTIADASGALQLALMLLQDNHSFIMTTEKQYISSNSVSCNDSPVTITSVLNNIGYVKVSGFSGGGAQAEAFAQSIQNDILAKDKAGLKGWIVDLRGNTGGNMWPMLAGIGPILGPGICGHFIDHDNNTSNWEYSADGISRIDGVPVSRAPNHYTLLNPNPKVAVLTDNATASSGEAIAIAFVGRNNTQSFGKLTCGLSTANQSYNLSDGSVLYLTVSFMADRSRKKYGAAVIPDEITTANGDALTKAIDWLSQ